MAKLLNRKLFLPFNNNIQTWRPSYFSFSSQQYSTLLSSKCNLPPTSVIHVFALDLKPKLKMSTHHLNNHQFNILNTLPTKVLLLLPINKHNNILCSCQVWHDPVVRKSKSKVKNKEHSLLTRTVLVRGVDPTKNSWGVTRSMEVRIKSMETIMELLEIAMSYPAILMPFGVIPTCSWGRIQLSSETKTKELEIKIVFLEIKISF